MEIQIQPYLFFDGRCEEAVAFYKEALGAEVVMLMRYRDSPEQAPGSVPPGGEDKVMHAALKIGEASLLVSDGLCGGQPSFKGFSLALWVPDAATAARRSPPWRRAGRCSCPLAPTFFSPRLRHGGRQVRRALDGRRPPQSVFGATEHVEDSWAYRPSAYLRRARAYRPSCSRRGNPWAYRPSARMRRALAPWSGRWSDPRP